MQKFNVGDIVRRKNGTVLYEIIEITVNGGLLVQAVRYKNKDKLSPKGVVIVEKYKK